MGRGLLFKNYLLFHCLDNKLFFFSFFFCDLFLVFVFSDLTWKEFVHFSGGVKVLNHSSWSNIPNCVTQVLH